MLFIGFLALNLFLIGIGFFAGFLWGSKNCQNEIETAFQQGYNEGVNKRDNTNQ